MGSLLSCGRCYFCYENGTKNRYVCSFDRPCILRNDAQGFDSNVLSERPRKPSWKEPGICHNGICTVRTSGKYLTIRQSLQALVFACSFDTPCNRRNALQSSDSNFLSGQLRKTSWCGSGCTRHTSTRGPRLRHCRVKCRVTYNRRVSNNPLSARDSRISFLCSLDEHT